MDLLNLYQNNYMIVFIFLCLGDCSLIVALFIGKTSAA